MSSPCDRFAGVPSPIAKCQTCGFARKDHAPAALAPAAAAAPATPPKRASVSDPAAAAINLSASLAPPGFTRPQSASVSGAAAAVAAAASTSAIAAASAASQVATSVGPQVTAAAASAAAAAGSAAEAGLAEFNSRAAAAEAKISQTKKVVDDATASMAALAAQPAIWKEYKDDDGRTYFYNTASAESVWEIPPEYAKILAEKKRLEKVKQDAQKEFETARSALDKVAAEKSAAVKAAADSARVAAEQLKASAAAAAASTGCAKRVAGR